MNVQFAYLLLSVEIYSKGLLEFRDHYCSSLSRVSMKKLLYQLEQDYPCDFSLFFDPETISQFKAEVTEDRIFYDSDHRIVMTIKPSCQIVVRKGYRWDGCSPKFNILNLFWVGTPDGLVIGSEREVDQKGIDVDIPIGSERITHKASAVHDVLGYCKRDPKMPSIFKAYGSDLWLSPGRRARDTLFLKILKEKRFSPRFIYYGVTALLGPFFDAIFGASSVPTNDGNR
jgi:hypothetical protein